MAFVYTSEAGANAGGQPIYRRYSFAANGELSGAPLTLSGNELIKAELEIGVHFTTNGSTGVRISQQSPNLWHMPNGHPLPLYTLDSGDLMVSTDNSGTFSNGAMISAASNSKQHALLTDSSGSSFAIPAGSSAIASYTLDANGNPQADQSNVYGYALLIQDDSSNAVTRYTFDITGTQTAATELSDREVSTLSCC